MTNDITRHRKSARMTQTVVHNGLVYTAGQVGKGRDITEQTTDVLRNIDACLAEAGTDKSKILTATVWITDMEQFGAMNAVWDAWIDPQNPPARACTQAALALPEFLVEIMIVASL